MSFPSMGDDFFVLWECILVGFLKGSFLLVFFVVGA
jgi:hypothetical protein